MSTRIEALNDLGVRVLRATTDEDYPQTRLAGLVYELLVEMRDMARELERSRGPLR